MRSSGPGIYKAARLRCGANLLDEQALQEEEGVLTSKLLWTAFIVWAKSQRRRGHVERLCEPGLRHCLSGLRRDWESLQVISN